MKRLLAIIAILPLLMGAGEVKTVSGKADSALKLVEGKATASVKTMAGKAYNDGDSDNCTGSETMGLTDVMSGTAAVADEAAYVFGTFTAPCTGGLNAGYVYLGVDSGTASVKLSVYEDLSGSTGSCGATDGAPNDTCDTVVGTSGDITCAEANNWYNNTFASGSVTKGAKYFFVIYGGPGSGSARIARQADGASYFTDYDASCNGFDGPGFSEITAAGGCSFPTDDGYQVSVYVTLKAP